MRGDLPHAEHNLRDKFRPGVRIHLGQERGFQESELLEPYGILDDQIELLETNLGRPGVRGDGLTDDLVPVMLQAEFEEPGFETKPLGETREDGTE